MVYGQVILHGQPYLENTHFKSSFSVFLMHISTLKAPEVLHYSKQNLTFWVISQLYLIMWLSSL